MDGVHDFLACVLHLVPLICFGGMCRDVLLDGLSIFLEFGSFI